jgi:hypothetical protein
MASCSLSGDTCSLMLQKGSKPLRSKLRRRRPVGTACTTVMMLSTCQRVRSNVVWLCATGCGVMMMWLMCQTKESEEGSSRRTMGRSERCTQPQFRSALGDTSCATGSHTTPHATSAPACACSLTHSLSHSLTHHSPAAATPGSASARSWRVRGPAARGCRCADTRLAPLPRRLP